MVVVLWLLRLVLVGAVVDFSGALNAVFFVSGVVVDVRTASRAVVGVERYSSTVLPYTVGVVLLGGLLVSAGAVA